MVCAVRKMRFLICGGICMASLQSRVAALEFRRGSFWNVKPKLIVELLIFPVWDVFFLLLRFGSMDPTRLHDDPNQNQVQPPTLTLIESRPRIDLRGPREWLRTSSCCCTPVIVCSVVGLVPPNQGPQVQLRSVCCRWELFYRSVRCTPDPTVTRIQP